MPARPGSEFDNVARGGSTRWTGKGPKPARHIPWPEVFKHHISVVEGHQRMIDMIRKHTIEGTPNHRTIMACLERANTMLKDTKEATRNFVEPAGARESVPIGAASDSMYVGYSPADHVYGDAANQYGQRATQLKKNGVEEQLDPNGPEYQVGQSARSSRKSIKDLRATQDAAAARHMAGHMSGANGVPVAERKPVDPPAAESNPYFVIDSNPTPVNGAAEPVKGSKRAGAGEDRPNKKSKLSQEADADSSAAQAQPVGETEDISAEVDARLAEKEKKRKEKKEKKDKKRKRDSEVSAEDEEADAGDKMDLDEPEKADKPKKKKSKKTKEETEPEPVADAEEAVEKPKKKGKKSKDTADQDKKREAEDEIADEESKAKKSKKSKKEKKEKA